MKKLTSSLFIIFFCTPILIAQTKMDSFKNNIRLAKGNDSLQAERYMDLAFDVLAYNPDELEIGIENIKSAIVLSSKHQNIPQLMTEYNYIGIVRRQQGRYEESILAHQKALSLGEEEYKTATAKRKKTLEIHIPKIKGNIASVYNEQSKFDEALEVRLSVIDDLKKQNDADGLAKAYGNITSDFIQAHKYKKAIEYAQKGKAVYKNDTENIELSALYGNMGICHASLGNLDSALYYFLICRKISKSKKQLHLDNEADIAKLYAAQKKYILSNQTFDNLFAQYDVNSKNHNLNFYKLLAAESYLKQNNFTKANQLFNQAKDNIVAELLPERKKLGEVGMKINRYYKNYKEALRYADLFHEVKDSMNIARRDSSFRVIESKYQVGQKEVKINRQKIKLRNFSLGLVGALALLVIGGILFFGYRRKMNLEKKLTQEKTEKQLIEIENLKKEVKIISMQSMIEGQEEERKRIARDLHDNIGTLMTSIKMKVLAIQREVQNLEKMNIATELDSMIDSATQQVRRISYSMTPIALDISGLAPAIKDLGLQLTENNIELHANLKTLEKIEDKKLSINIYRILQELIQNIIKHAQATEVSIDISEKENNIIMRVRDNGIGMSQEKWDTSKSIGVNNIKSRVNYLNGTVKLVADIGTHFKISFPTNQ